MPGLLGGPGALGAVGIRGGVGTLAQGSTLAVESTLAARGVEVLAFVWLFGAWLGVEGLLALKRLVGA